MEKDNTTYRDFQKEYQRIMKNAWPFDQQVLQWKSNGDMFQKFTLLEKSPTIISSNTVTLPEQDKTYAELE